MEKFLGDVDRLRSALNALQTDNVVQDSWRRSKTARDGALAYTEQQLIAKGFNEKQVAVPITNIPQILDFLSLASRPTHLGGLKIGPLIEAVLATNTADTPSVGKPYNNEALRVLVFEGNLLAKLELRPPDQKEILLVPIGAAILVDMFNSIPDSQTLRDVLSKGNESFSSEIRKMPLDFDHDRTVSDDFRFAAESLDKRRDVLVLDLPL